MNMERYPLRIAVRNKLTVLDGTIYTRLLIITIARSVGLTGDSEPRASSTHILVESSEEVLQ